MTATTLGQKIRTLRKEKKLTLDELAAQTDSSKSYIWELENRPTARPSAEKIQRIAEILGVTSEYLINEERSDPTASDRDQAFFQRFTGLTDQKKDQLEKILKLLDDD